MLPIFNERLYAQKMNDGWAKDREQEDKRKYSFRELLIYAKWLRSLSSHRTEEEQDKLLYTGIVSFCNQLQLHFDIDTDYYMIENLIKKSKQFRLREHNPSFISQKEWLDILSISSEDARKFYFACLVLGKFNRNNPVIDLSRDKEIEYTDTRLRIKYSKDIFKYAKITFKLIDKENDPNLVMRPLKILYDMGLIDMSLTKKGLYIILNQADLQVLPENIFMTITHYSDIAAYYKYGLSQRGYKICKKCGRAFYTKSSHLQTCDMCREQIGEHIYMVCPECGVRFERNKKANNTIMCVECSREKRKRDKAEKMRNFRNKNI